MKSYTVKILHFRSKDLHVANCLRVKLNYLMLGSVALGKTLTEKVLSVSIALKMII